jgi:hypothetical protein
MKNPKKTILLMMVILIGAIFLIRKKETPVATENRIAADSMEKNEITPSADPVSMNRETTECKRIRFKHLEQNQNRDLEEFTDDLNAFQLPEADANTHSVCMKVNRKPVHHRIRKGKLGPEVWIGSVIGPDSEIELSYCLGKTQCRESCAIKSSNKVDDLINEEELSSLGDRELEMKVKELGKVAENQNKLMDGSVIRDWNRIGTESWSCNHQ